MNSNHNCNVDVYRFRLDTPIGFKGDEITRDLCVATKSRFKMTIDEFEDDTKNYYGIENINEIADLISSGMNIDEVCTSLNMNEEQKSIVGLILARDCYAQENYTLGDKYLKRVEKTKNKTKYVNSLTEEIRKNKRFYKNRVQENHKFLILTRKPNKS